MSERLLQALRRGGCAAPYQGAWGVWRGRDRRGSCIGQLSDMAIETLQLAGDVGRLGEEGEVLVWTGQMARCEETRNLKTPLPAGQSRAPRRSPLLIVLSVIEAPEDKALAKAAVSRLLGDLEQALSGQKVTQNWDPSLHVDGVGGSRTGGRMAGAVRANRRLAQVEACLGRADLDLLYQLVVQERSLAALGANLGQSGRKLQLGLAQRLMALARAYKLSVGTA
ncbi:MAG: DUF6456 domain-containing protein [Hyphomonadaceae bacterium]|nr:DUF6456 domain-containing protein [Hyphomonadaceae bacterium]